MVVYYRNLVSVLATETKIKFRYRYPSQKKFLHKPKLPPFSFPQSFLMLFRPLFFVTALVNTYCLGAMRIRKSLIRRLERLLIAITVIPLVAVLIVVPLTLAIYLLVYVPQTVEVGWLVLWSPEWST